MRFRQIYYAAIIITMAVAASNAIAGNISVHAARNIANQYMKQHCRSGFRAPAMADLQLVHAEASRAINTDGKVNIIDLTTLIDHLLGGGGTINHDAADVDNKNGVTIADLAILIDLMLTNT
jgi:hypothetical protein